MAATRWISSPVKGPSNRHEVFYFAEAQIGALRIDNFKLRFIDQPDG